MLKDIAEKLNLCSHFGENFCIQLIKNFGAFDLHLFLLIRIFIEDSIIRKHEFSIKL